MNKFENSRILRFQCHECLFKTLLLASAYAFLSKDFKECKYLFLIFYGHECILQEIHTLKTQLEAAKFDVIKYCIGKATAQ
jgi:hypothetical protein